MDSITTCIKAAFIIAFDGRKHRILRNGEIAYRGSEIIYVGPGFEGHVDRNIEAANGIVSPGFISTHAHLYESPLDRSFIEDKGSPHFFMSGLFETLPVRDGAMDAEMYSTCLKYSLAELIRSGTTTVVELGPCAAELVELVPASGNRVYIGQSFRSGKWLTRDGRRVVWEWLPDYGQQSMQSAIEILLEYDGACEGLVRGIIAPGQVDTCTSEMLQLSRDYAQKHNMPLTIHCSQSVIEFNEMIQRYGVTPTAWLQSIGVLQSNTILGHAIIIGGSSWSNYPSGDLDIMAAAGCSVAHSPWVFARRGIALESFHRYQSAGINMSLGTDTCSQDMLAAMRWAAVLSKVYERNAEATTAADIFNAATLGGARALGRTDLGRLCPGAKADMVIFSGSGVNMVPLRDPVKNIVFSSEKEDVDTVVINGRTVMDKGELIGIDLHALTRELQAAGERMWPRMADHDWAGRSVDEISPMSFDLWEETPAK